MENHQDSRQSFICRPFTRMIVILSTLKKTIGLAMKKNVKGLPRPITGVVLFSLLVVITVGVRAQRDSRTPPSGPAEIVRFTVYDAGIFPKEVSVSAGTIALHIEDMSAGSAGLVVANGASETVAQVTRREQRRRDNAYISLSPGRYTVSDASRPRNRAILIVEP